ncbi:hypothetical protein [Sphingomonas sp. Root241]|uniref:hypothetical protein n=1 Tax=Sphingomonas sp. Root241 TaxID=1736501 RepID=UPI000A888C41|nr:hypothetical protein [Sphingomonas sp. Root241]
MYAWIEIARNPGSTFDDFLSLRAAAFTCGRSGLEELLLYGRTAGIEEVLQLLDASGEAIVNMAAARRPDEIGAIALWLPIYDAVRKSPGFAAAERRIVLTAPNQR